MSRGEEPTTARKFRELREKFEWRRSVTCCFAGGLCGAVLSFDCERHARDVGILPPIEVAPGQTSHAIQSHSDTGRGHVGLGLPNRVCAEVKDRGGENGARMALFNPVNQVI
jgi:hypothetical protein